MDLATIDLTNWDASEAIPSLLPKKAKDAQPRPRKRRREEVHFMTSDAGYDVSYWHGTGTYQKEVERRIRKDAEVGKIYDKGFLAALQLYIQYHHFENTCTKTTDGGLAPAWRKVLHKAVKAGQLTQRARRNLEGAMLTSRKRKRYDKIYEDMMDCVMEERIR